MSICWSLGLQAVFKWSSSNLLSATREFRSIADGIDIIKTLVSKLEPKLYFNWLATDLVMKIQDCVEVWYHVQVILTAVLSESFNCQLKKGS